MRYRCGIFIALFLLACNAGDDLPLTAWSGIRAVRCKNDTVYCYHYTLPAKPQGRLPLLIVLDSGGDGLFAVKKVQPSANIFPCIIIGSDKIKNNVPDYITAIHQLITEAVNQFPVEKDQIYLAGFSGGARMAFEYARQFPVKGVLMCGAGPSGDSFSDLPCPVYMIAGTTDFNFAEMYYDPLKTPAQKDFMADYFRGPHEWPPADKIRDGLLFLTGGGNKKLMKKESGLLSHKADSLINHNEIFFGIKSVEKALRFDPSNRTAKKLQRLLKEDRRLAGQIRKIESNLELESRIGQAYARATLDHDSIWWSNEIRQLLKKIDENTGTERDHFMRIKSFLGILYYSRLNSLLSSDSGNSQIPHLLSAYRMIEPNNPDVYYDYALYEKSRGNILRYHAYLKKASLLGFKPA